jgi:hypothetical protein
MDSSVIDATAKLVEITSKDGSKISRKKRRSKIRHSHSNRH